MGSTMVGADSTSWGPKIYEWISWGGECGPFDDLFPSFLRVGRRDTRGGLGLYKTVAQPAVHKRLPLVTSKPEESFLICINMAQTSLLCF